MNFFGVYPFYRHNFKIAFYMKSAGSLFVLTFFTFLVEKRDPFQKIVKATTVVKWECFNMTLAKALDENLIWRLSVLTSWRHGINIMRAGKPHCSASISILRPVLDWSVSLGKLGLWLSANISKGHCDIGTGSKLRRSDVDSRTIFA